MIDVKTKIKLIEELEKDGNVYRACAKVGIGTSSFYRWKQEDKDFKNKATAAIKLGRENICYIGEHALLNLVKEKDLGAIKYLLGHNSPIYKPKTTSKVILEHTRKLRPSDLPPPPTLEDLLDKWETMDESEGEDEARPFLPAQNLPATESPIDAPDPVQPEPPQNGDKPIDPRRRRPRRLFPENEL